MHQTKLASTAVEEPHHSENGDNVGSQPDDVMPGSESGSLCTRSEIIHFEIVESSKKEARPLVHLMRLARTKIQRIFRTIGSTNDPATWPGVMSRKVRGYLAQRRPLTITTKVFPRKESDGTRFCRFHCKKVLPNGEALARPRL